MSYALLTFSRSTYTVVELRAPGVEPVEVVDDPSDQMYIQAYQKLLSDSRASTASGGTDVDSKYELKVDSDGMAEVWADGVVVVPRTTARMAEAWLRNSLENVKRTPAPVVTTRVVREVPTWIATFAVDGVEEDLTLPPGLDWRFGYPAKWVVRELDRLAAEGWTLAHTSEDHGLYQGDGKGDEAFVTRARFLLRRT